MAEKLSIPHSDKREVIYAALMPQIASLLSSEPDRIANLANVSAVLKEAFGFFWVGFYLSQGDELVLGPFQGPLACTRIRRGRGVCGTVFATGESLIVPDVDQFPGHIACSSASRSEIVLPIRRAGLVVGVLDIDSTQLDDFSSIDQHYLALICEQVATFF